MFTVTYFSAQYPKRYCERSRCRPFEAENPQGGEIRDTNTRNLSRNIVSSQVLVDVSGCSLAVINLTRYMQHADCLLC